MGRGWGVGRASSMPLTVSTFHSHLRGRVFGDRSPRERLQRDLASSFFPMGSLYSRAGRRTGGPQYTVVTP